MSFSMFDNFQMYFPSLASVAVDHYSVDDFELVVKLNDGSSILYDDIDKSIRNLPRDSRAMSERECKCEFGSRLRKIMAHRGITQAELSEMTGIQQASISRYCSGVKSPSFYNADKIAKALGCSIDEFRYLD